MIKDTLVYDGWGNITSETDSNFRGRYAWTGREIDTEINLQYNRARYYDPKIGRWISQDSLGFDAGDSNLFRYVNNNPVGGSDPSGKVVVFFDGWGGSSQDGKIFVDTTKDPNAYPLYQWVDKRFAQQSGHIETFAAVQYIKNKVGPASCQKEPIILIGHSLGGKSAVQASILLMGANYYVDFQATLDSVTLGTGTLVGLPNGLFSSLNVKVPWNWYQTVTKPRGGRLIGFGVKNIKNAVASEQVNDKKKGQILGHTDLDDEKTIARAIREETQRIIKPWKPGDHRFWKLPELPKVGDFFWKEIATLH